MAHTGDNGQAQDNTNMPSETQQKAYSDSNTTTSDERARIDMQYYCGDISLAEHAEKSRALLQEAQNSLRATLPAALQTSRSAPTSLTEVLDKVLPSDTIDAQPPSGSPFDRGKKNTRNG